MNHIIIIGLMGTLTACSMVPNQTTQQHNTIRVIKEEPRHHEYHRKYNSKIEQVDYNSSVIAPEIESKYKREPKIHKRDKGSQIINRVIHKTSNKVSSKARQIGRKAIPL